MVTVFADTPYTVLVLPAPATVAIDVLPLVQVPPPARSDKEVVLPTHTLRVPPMVDGAVFTVTIVVAIQPAVVV